MTCVLDACALIALFKKEQGADKVKELLDNALNGQDLIYMSTVNLIEVYYGFYREMKREQAALILEQIYKMPIHFIDAIDKPVIDEASRLKALYYIPLGDAIGLATAVTINGTFVSSDHTDLDQIEESEPISFFWLR
ncbi:MAG: type II toxin-antitoxin system VapC family toxin [Spirochaetaceae bacterium]|nr:type II toxin-antitoxin system VapC family toxin [Spirochaetaceae bacterium]